MVCSDFSHFQKEKSGPERDMLSQGHLAGVMGETRRDMDLLSPEPEEAHVASPQPGLVLGRVSSGRRTRAHHETRGCHAAGPASLPHRARVVEEYRCQSTQWIVM